ncbi:MAG: gamma-glutamyltransferase [Myxococcota bacterium]
MRLARLWWAAVLLALVVLFVMPDVSRADSAATGTRFAVATESEQATRAAMRTLRDGGHAVDAAVTAALMLGVVNPTSSGIGGGGFALVWDAKSAKMVVLDFRETAPGGIDPASLDARPVPDAKRGVVVGVPGEVAGLVEMHRRWGKRAFADNACPAIRAARGGFRLEMHMARMLRAHGDALVQSKPIAALFFPTGSPLGKGARVHNPKLAATLGAIAARGADAFYRGPIAADIAAAVQRHGGAMTKQDLASYRVVERQSLRARWAGFDVHTMPPPSAGGLLLAQTLLMHDQEAIVRMGDQSPELVHTLAETFRGSIADRVRTVGDPMHVNVPMSALLSEAHLARRKARIRPNVSHAPRDFGLPEHGTTHLVVVDADRNVVSLTTTVNRSFGSKIVAPASGVVLNDELDDFTPPSVLPSFGVRPSGPNAPRPGARPVSSMSPTIVLRGGKPYLALGGSGGMKIAPNVTQIALRVLAFDASARDAVSSPRFSVDVRSPGLVVEPGWLTEQAVRDLSSRGELLRTSSFPAAVQLVRMQLGPNGDGMQAASDPRKFGLGAVE